MEENKTSVADSIDVESMAVEDKYDGPRLADGGKVTIQFMQVSHPSRLRWFLSYLPISCSEKVILVITTPPYDSQGNLINNIQRTSV